MKENSYVILHNDIDHKNGLLYSYETIKGKDYKDALKKRFGVAFERLYGDDGRYAEVILIKGYFDHENNNIIYKGRKALKLCYSRA